MLTAGAPLPRSGEHDSSRPSLVGRHTGRVECVADSVLDLIEVVEPELLRAMNAVGVAGPHANVQPPHCLGPIGNRPGGFVSLVTNETVGLMVPLCCSAIFAFLLCHPSPGKAWAGHSRCLVEQVSQHTSIPDLHTELVCALATVVVNAARSRHSRELRAEDVPSAVSL